MGKPQTGDFTGVPACWNLQYFGTLIEDAFDNWAYQVGSSTQTTEWRDVDVRLILDDEEWQSWGFGDPANPNAKWQAICHAFTELGRAVTGLPIDFQIQQMTRANEQYKGERRNGLISRSRLKEAATTPTAGGSTRLEQEADDTEE